MRGRLVSTKPFDSNAHHEATWEYMQEVVDREPDSYDQSMLDWMYIDSFHWVAWA